MTVTTKRTESYFIWHKSNGMTWKTSLTATQAVLLCLIFVLEGKVSYFHLEGDGYFNVECAIHDPVYCSSLRLSSWLRCLVDAVKKVHIYLG